MDDVDSAVSSKLAEETIYLCNFRVSVDGDWLCLRELQDVHIMDRFITSPTRTEPEQLSVEEIDGMLWIS